MTNPEARVRLLTKGPIEKSLGVKIPAGTILEPVKRTNGVIFPYTPMINVAHNSNYGSHQPTHSNFQYRFFQNYALQEITCSAPFTSATTAEARHALACVHFFRTCMKMGFGENDPLRGIPPPVLNFSAYGPGMFQNIPVVITNLSFALDTGSDYVFARTETADGIGMANDLVSQTLLPINWTVILTLAPTYNTKQTRTQFKLQDFASGALLRKGYN